MNFQHLHHTFGGRLQDYEIHAGIIIRQFRFDALNARRLISPNERCHGLPEHIDKRERAYACLTADIVDCYFVSGGLWDDTGNCRQFPGTVQSNRTVGAHAFDAELSDTVGEKHASADGGIL